MIKPQNLLPNLSPRQPLEDEYISETDGVPSATPHGRKR